MQDKCKDCGCELHVAGSRNVVTHTPEDEIRLYVVLEMECVNPQCESYGEKMDFPIEQQIEVNEVKDGGTSAQGGDQNN